MADCPPTVRCTTEWTPVVVTEVKSRTHIELDGIPRRVYLGSSTGPGSERGRCARLLHRPRTARRVCGHYGSGVRVRSKLLCFQATAVDPRRSWKQKTFEPGFDLGQ